MLQLKNITKSYPVAGGEVQALKGVSINFRKNEFVSILGASGCGKTTLLNIIGGLDKYTSGDLVIQGTSTKEYKNRDWDTYRNHSIGFIFQSYHLIPHQTILQNVELALTISGISKAERRTRAMEALKKVGLDEKLNVRPNQLSGGQAQRVAIARALINDPEIVLADEPTGALDSKTSVQIMELLKEISRDRLVIMVTHNPELAETYSTRIIRLLDGLVIDDTAPYDGGQTDEESDKHAKTDDISGVTEEETPDGEGKEKSAQTPDVPQKGKKKKSAMSVWMAFSLSLKNLLSKGKRTAMVSVAGSIGIIGVSMVLAISSGVRGFIASMEDDLLSGYPLSVEETAIDYEALTSFATTSNKTATPFRLKDKVYVNSLLDTLIGFKGLEVTNTITEDYVNYLESMPKEYYNALQYGYDFDMSNYIYTDFKVTDGELDPALDTSGNYSVSGIRSIYSSVLKQQPKYGKYAGMISTISSFDELPDNSSYILSQYDILATASGKTQKQLSNEEIAEIFESEDSIIMVVSHNAFSDLNFGQYGYMTEDEFLNFAYKSAGDEYDQSVIDKYNGKIKEDGTYDENFQGTDFSFFVGETAKNFTWYPNNTIFTENPLYGTVDGMPPFVYNPSSANFDKSQGTTLKVKAILQKKEGISYGCMSSGLYYTKALSQKTVANGVNADSFATGFMYEDNGNQFEQELHREGVPYKFVWNKGRVRENYKFVDRRSMLTEIDDISAEVSTEKQKELVNLVKQISKTAEAVVISGSLAKGMTPDYYARILNAVPPNAKKIVDTEGERLFQALKTGVDLVKPNLDELERTLKKPLKNKTDMLSACDELLNRGSKTVLLSLGKRGAIITDGNKHYYSKSVNVAMNSTVGAGDGMVAAATQALVEGRSLQEILRRGVAAGTAAVTSPNSISFAKDKFDEILSSLEVKEI